MVGFKASTEENLVREKEQNMFYFTRKTRISCGLYDIQYISIRAPFFALQMSSLYSASYRTWESISGMTVAIVVLILSFRCRRSLIFSAYTMFLLYLQKKKIKNN
jgi:hypothetical protein